ncbi:MAG: Rieske 2Fe-2S domain-containing protein [Alphaproteobacteria bacterium]|nr:Rieske 2Fe-2S domain-containing protein [Alphaproteobacteria bacterium]
MDAAGHQVPDPYATTGVPQLGLRNYWYPVLAGWRLRRKPRAIKILGEEIVLYRDAGKIYALSDRCPHRGARLSQGKCLYPGSGTVSCPYHGWTFAGETGQCIAKIMEGPDAALPRRSHVKAYPVREHLGAIWVFVGDMEAVPLSDDLPECLADTNTWHGFSTWRTYRCNWRILKDNLCHDLHAPFLHRNAPELLLQPIFPYAAQISATPLKGGKGIGYSARDGISSAEYPGLGAFPPPQESWYRVLKPVGRGQEVGAAAPAVAKYGYQFRQSSLLPGITLIGRPSGNYFTCRWVTPIDADTTLYYSFSMFRRRGRLQTLRDRLAWIFWLSWMHDWLFSEQDKRILEKVVPGRELLSRSDIGVVAWRRFAVAHARRPPDVTSEPAANDEPALHSTAAE